MFGSNTRWITGCAAAAAMLMAVGVSAQGPLIPPGAPAPVMKSLDQVEPRIPLGTPPTFPINITAAGSYYLTGNLRVTTSNTNAIFINSSNVTIDLSGYTIIGPGNVGSTGNGITVTGTGAITDIVIKNGSVSNFRGEGISIPVGTAANNNGTVTAVMLSNLQVVSCNLGQGVDGNLAGIRTGSVGIMENCISRNNTNNGFIVGNGMIVRNCVADNNGRNGMIIGRDNYIHDNILKNNGAANNRDDAGLYLPGIVTAFPVPAIRNRIENNHFMNNSDFGVQVGSVGIAANNNANRNLLIGNFATDNGDNSQGDNYQFATGTSNRFGALANVGGNGSFSTDQPFTNFFY